MSRDGGRATPAGPVRVEVLEEGALWRVVLARPKGNILDAEMIGALSSIFEKARAEAPLKALLIEGEGPHFSFGASVEEHLPEHAAAMLRSLHGMFHRMLDASVVQLAVVRGQCLGGALELASLCHRVFASPGARLGQPEIVLGVFAPVASVALPERIGRARAEDLCLSGRVVDAAEALRLGLVDAVADDPLAAALAYARAHLLPRSASSLRFAVRAVRAGFAERFGARLAQVEKLYLEDLMATHDAVEGLRAFLEKRPARWRHA